MIDMHCHVLYGVDDGSRTFEESLAMIKAAQTIGFKGIVLTPHYMSYTQYTSSLNHNRIIHKHLKKLLVEEGVDIQLYLGNEIFYEPDLLPVLERGEFITLNRNGFFLIETMRHDADKDHFLDFLYRIQLKGYRTIVAHPERYDFVQDNPGVLIDFLDRGHLLQINALSLIGFYGKHAKETAEVLLKHNMVQFMASDAHRVHAYQKMPEALDIALDLIGPKNFRRIMIDNPAVSLGAKGDIVINPLEN